MSDFGIGWKTDANNMAISSEGYGLAYIGQAWSQGYYNRGPQTSPVCTAYAVNSMYMPLAFIEAPNNVMSRVVSINQISGSAWTVIVASIQGLNVSTTTPVRYEPVVHVFARLSVTAPAESWGLLVKDASGNRAWDSRENMLSARALIDWPAQDFSHGHEQRQSYAYPSRIARPAHCGFGIAGGESIIGRNAGKKQFYHTGGFRLDDGLVERGVMVDSSGFYDDNINSQTPLNGSYQQECSIIIDVADYV